ncbi:sensor histidine kinase [Robertkochia aurantiaca]|uniref:sensor histidine kinase n=1 Tax=Robertkochia aurantiaca TaxID=2873700 RepID=UPI001CCA0920|nr:histidine kinase [Robertkochia sp. 3YJGBD-33]
METQRNYKPENITVKEILKRIGFALATGLLLYSILIYLNHGVEGFVRFVSNLDNVLIYKDMSMSMIFVLALFLYQAALTRFVHSKTFQLLKSWIRITLEFLLLFTGTLFLSWLTMVLPAALLLPGFEFPDINIRIAYVSCSALSLFFYYFIEKQRQQKLLEKELLRNARLQREQIRTELQNLKNNVKPHFLFNSLNVLSTLIKRDSDKAELFVNKLSELYRSFLTFDRNPLITVKEELKLVKDYIFLLETRFGNTVHFSFDIPESAMNRKIPAGSLQLLVENALKHNIATKKRPLEVSITADSENLKVLNNLQLRKEKVVSTRTGLSNISSRYQHLADKEIKIYSNDEEFGVELPLLDPS